MKKASSDPSQASITASHDVEYAHVLPFQVPGLLDVAALPGSGATTCNDDDGPELFPPEFPDRATGEREKEIKDYMAKHQTIKGTDNGLELELSYPPGVSPDDDSPAKVATALITMSTSLPLVTAASRQPGAEYVNGSRLRTALSSYHHVDGHVNLPIGQQRESTHHLVAATLVEPAPIAEVVIDSEIPKSRKFLWTGGICLVTIVVFLVIIIYVIVMQLTVTNPDYSEQIQWALNPVLSNMSIEDIATIGTPQYQAFQWLKEREGVGSLSNERIRQLYALATLYHATNGEQWNHPSGWLSNDDECKWYFSNSTNNCDNGILTRLDLSRNNLNGFVPPDISILSSLTSLDLVYNALTGTIPSSLGQVASLTYLDCGMNSLTGPIPTFLGQLTNLAVLSLWGNSLNSTIPPFLGQVTSLTYLELGGNSLAGSIPTFLDQLTNLEYLLLPDNSLTGTIPSLVCAFVNLSEIRLDCDKVSCGCGSICTCW